MQIDMIFVAGLQAEIQAAYKECECVRMKLKLQEDDLLKMRTRMNDAEDAHHTRYSKLKFLSLLMISLALLDEMRLLYDLFFSVIIVSDDLQARFIEQQDKLEQMQKLAIGLQVQLSEAQGNAADMRAVRDRLVKEFDEERQALQDALDGAIIDRAEIEVHWQREYELLRTVNSGKIAAMMMPTHFNFNRNFSGDHRQIAKST